MQSSALANEKIYGGKSVEITDHCLDILFFTTYTIY